MFCIHSQRKKRWTRRKGNEAVSDEFGRDDYSPFLEENERREEEKKILKSQKKKNLQVRKSRRGRKSFFHSPCFLLDLPQISHGLPFQLALALRKKSLNTCSVTTHVLLLPSYHPSIWMHKSRRQRRSIIIATFFTLAATFFSHFLPFLCAGLFGPNWKKYSSTRITPSCSPSISLLFSWA